MNDDPRCCGSGTCIIDGQGRCWCGQQWDGHQMCTPPVVLKPPAAAPSDPDAAPDAVRPRTPRTGA